MRNEYFRRYGFRILLVIFFIMPFVWMGTKRTLMSNSNNVADWLPKTFEETKQYQWFLENFPFERFVVVSWKGCTMDDPGDRLELFAQKLVPGQTIDNMDQWMGDNAITAEIDKPNREIDLGLPPPDPESLFSVSPASTPGAPPGPPSDVPAYTRYFKHVVTGPRLMRMLQNRYSAETGTAGATMSDAEIKKKLEGTLIGPDGKSTALIVTLSNEAPQGKALADVLEAIREVGRECGVHPPKKVDTRAWPIRIASTVWQALYEIPMGRNPDMSGVIIGGPPVDNVAITYEGEHTLYRLAGICAVVGLVLAWLCFRDFRLTFFVFWIAIFSAGIALACVSLTGSTCDAILLSMPALVYVLAMSGAIHVINYYHDAVREDGLHLAPERAIGHAWYPCFFANFTTALGLVSLYASHLVPITKFGVYAALGVMLQLAILFYYLPTLLYFYPSRKIAAERANYSAENSRMQKVWRVWGGFMIRNNMAVSLACIALMIFMGFGLLKIKTSVKMMRFFSADSEIIHHYTWLEEHIGPLVPMEVVIRFDNERCKFNTLERLRLIEDIGSRLRTELVDPVDGVNLVGGVMSAETMLPYIERSGPGRKSARQLVYERAACSLIDKKRGELRDSVVVEGNRSFHPDDPHYRTTLAEMEMSAADAVRLVQSGIDDIKKLYDFPAEERTFNISAAEMTVFKEKAAKWEQEHGHDLWRLSLRVWSLKKDIDYALFIQNVKDVVDPMIAAKTAQAFPESKGVDGTGAIEALYTGMVPLVYKTQHELMAGLRDSFITSFIMIGITMAFILKSPIAGFCAMIPNVFPTVVVFGFMGQCGFLVDVGTMMTASVALGISVDDTIHFLTWFRDGVDKGMNQEEATRFAYSRCATSMFQTTLIAGLGLSAFALSTFTPTQMFGIMMLAILTAALLGDIIFLAAILNTPLGRCFRPKTKRVAHATTEPGDAENAPDPEAERRYDIPHSHVAIQRTEPRAASGK